MPDGVRRPGHAQRGRRRHDHHPDRRTIPTTAITGFTIATAAGQGRAWRAPARSDLLGTRAVCIATVDLHARTPDANGVRQLRSSPPPTTTPTETSAPATVDDHHHRGQRRRRLLVTGGRRRDHRRGRAAHRPSRPSRLLWRPTWRPRRGRPDARRMASPIPATSALFSVASRCHLTCGQRSPTPRQPTPTGAATVTVHRHRRRGYRQRRRRQRALTR